ncbi:MAG: DNA starvation/stationary phase protection protein [Helicobacter sp.]|nr:DNA starvation/stationary phase protection protein [Helicobacter sp.]
MSSVIPLLKRLQADAIVFVMKTHNFHWNVVGMDFHPTHLATEEIYEAFSDVYDDIAERLLQLGQKPLVTLKDVLAEAKISEESNTKFTSRQIVEAIEKDYTYFEKTFRELSEAASSAGDSVTAAFADDNLAKLQKSLWMLRAQLA